MNNYTAIGRLTRDAETKLLNSGKSVTSSDLAVDSGFGDRKQTIFWPCKLWGERGETFAKFVKKGHQVGIVAEINQEEWDDKATGEKRKKLVLNVRDFTLLSNGKREEGGQQQERPAQREQPQPAKPEYVASNEFTDDSDGVPF